MANAWLAQVKKTMKSEAGKKKSMGKKWFDHVLKTAKASYKGGAVASQAAPVMKGGKTRKTKRHGRK